MNFCHFNLYGYSSSYLNQMEIISMNILLVEQWRLTISPSTAFLIPSDSRIRSSRSSSAPMNRLFQLRDDRFTRSFVRSLSFLHRHIMRIVKTRRKYAHFINCPMSSSSSDGSSTSLSALHKGVNTSLHSWSICSLSVSSFLLFFLLVCDRIWSANVSCSPGKAIHQPCQERAECCQLQLLHL